MRSTSEVDERARQSHKHVSFLGLMQEKTQ